MKLRKLSLKNLDAVAVQSLKRSQAGGAANDAGLPVDFIQ